MHPVLHVQHRRVASQRGEDAALELDQRAVDPQLRIEVHVDVVQQREVRPVPPDLGAAYTFIQSYGV